MFKLLSLLSGIAVCLCSCNESSQVKQTGSAPLDSAAKIKRGAYLVTIQGCNDCHSPKRMGPHGPEVIPETALSGYPESRPLTQFDTSLAKRGIAQFNEDMTATAGPWGVSFAGNLTSDPTGAGSWPLENFKTALRHGKYKGLENARTLLPPMPWVGFSVMTDEDIAAVHAYLKSTKPVKNIPPVPIHFGAPAH